MAISTYSELQSAVGDFLNRQDLTTVIPTFIALAEADLNRSIRHRSMLTRSTATIDTQFTALPADFLEAKNIQLNSTPITVLRYVTMEHADLVRQRNPTGQPCYYSIVGDTLEVVPVPDASFTAELTYYKKLTALSDSDTTNWLLSYHPDVYLYGTLMQSAPYLKDDQRIPIWGSLYRQYLADVNASSDKAEFSGSALHMRPRTWI
jgi:hypothetical protein